MTDIAIADIQEGQRHRNDLGDIKSLAESMTEVGLLHPIVVTESLQLVAGGRRLAAARSLGWIEVPATIVRNITQADTLLQAESDENTQRKDFTPTEALSIKQAREALLKPLARDRQAEGGRTKASGKLPEASPRPRDVAARGTGYSSRTLDKVAQVKAVAEDIAAAEPVREVAKAALAEMDRTGKVDRGFKAVARAVDDADPTSQFLADDAHLADLNFQSDLADAIRKAHRAVLTFDPIEVGKRADPDQFDALDSLARSLTKFAATARENRAGLRVVNGGKR